MFVCVRSAHNLLLLVVSVWLGSCLAALSQEEMAVLEELYEATGGEVAESSWDEVCDDKWVFTPDYTYDACEEAWYGIVCNAGNTSIQKIELGSCGLQGMLPGNLSLLKLHTLNASNNVLYGSVPTEIMGMREMRVLDLSNNQLEGSLPTALSSLRELLLYDNSFGGSIPQTWTSMTELNNLNVSENFLTGTIPGGIGKLIRLRKLDFSENLLNGTIPLAIYQKLPSLEVLSLGSNFLTGPLSTALYNMDRLSDFDVSHNLLSGEIPSFNGSASAFAKDLPPLRHIYMSDNRFTSTIPNVFRYMSRLVLLDLSSNYLGGTIPSLLFNNSMSPLKFVYMQTNRLRGRIPDSIGNSFELMQLFLFENELTGPLPKSMNNLKQLQTLLLQDNKLTGQPGYVIKYTSPSARTEMMNELQILDLSNNLFTGQVPSEIFEIPKITYVSITEGCFEGSIPLSVCDAETLTHLILEGLSNGRECSKPVWDPLGVFANGFVYSGGLSGGVPGCLFQLKNLTTLHLSGNGLDGTIPSSTEPKKLKDFSLSYNQLTGTIPKNLLMSSYSQFDLSWNKLSGTCDDMRQWSQTDTEVESLLSLSYNRLSGDVPNSFLGLKEIDMLEGNVFTCPNRKSDLPEQDPNYLTYICASDDYDEMMSIWVSFFALFVCAATFFTIYYLLMNWQPKLTTCTSVHVTVMRWVNNFHDWNSRANAVNEADGIHLHSFIAFLKLLRSFVAKLAIFILVVYSTSYILLKRAGDYGTHTHQYRWLTSAAYLSGTWPAIFLVISLFCVVSYTFYSVIRFRIAISDSMASDPSSSLSSHRINSRVLSTNTIDSFFVHKDSKGNWKKAYLIIFFGLMVNAIVVLVVNGSYIYLVTWYHLGVNEVLAVQMAKSVFDILWNNVAIRIFMKRIKKTLRIKRLVRLVLAMLLFNNIIAPVLSTIFTDGNCFVGMFIDNHEIYTVTNLQYCSRLARNLTTDEQVCEIYSSLELETSYSPKFQYNYQCSSSFLSNFIPIYFFTWGLVTFAVPTCQAIMSYVLTNKLSPDKFPIVPPAAYFPGVPLRRNPRHHVFSTDMIVSKLLQNVTVMLTFGLACPNLAFVQGVHVFVMTWFYHLLLGRYLFIAKASSSSKIPPSTVAFIEGSCKENEAHNPMFKAVENDISKEDATASSQADGITHSKEGSIPFSDISSLRESWNSSPTIENPHKTKRVQYIDNENGKNPNRNESTHDERDSHQHYRPHKVIKSGSIDSILEEDCRGIILAPEVAIWTVIDLSVLCTAVLLLDVSGDTNGITKAFLTASLPVLCIPVLLRVVYRKYYMIPANLVAKMRSISGSTDGSSVKSELRGIEFRESGNTQTEKGKTEQEM